MKKRLLALAAALLLAIPVPTQAISDEDFAELTVLQVTLDVTLAVEVIAEAGPVWLAPYEAIADFLDTVEEGISKVEALTVPQCLSLWHDTVLLGLRMLEVSIRTVGEAAGTADDTHRAIFSATGPTGYSLLTDTAPALLEVADCSVVVEPDVT